MSGAELGATSKNKVYTELRRSIIMGHYKPGQRLILKDLAGHYQISITPLRDALQMLSQEGLVTIRPRSGYFITHVTLKELRDLFELREVLEMAAVERAAGRITEDVLQQMENVHAGYSGDDDASYDRYTDENRRFHYLVAEASGNHMLADMLARLHDRLARFMVLRAGGQTQPDSHARIVAALRAHDAAAACQAMLDELCETRDVVLERVIQEEGAAWSIGV